MRLNFKYNKIRIMQMRGVFWGRCIYATELIRKHIHP